MCFHAARLRTCTIFLTESSRPCVKLLQMDSLHVSVEKKVFLYLRAERSES
jgi:hypothetical protein